MCNFKAFKLASAKGIQRTVVKKLKLKKKK